MKQPTRRASKSEKNCSIKAFGLLGSFFFTFLVPLFGALAMLMSVLKIVLSIAMVFVIGETEARAANL